MPTNLNSPLFSCVYSFFTSPNNYESRLIALRLSQLPQNQSHDRQPGSNHQANQPEETVAHVRFKGSHAPLYGVKTAVKLLYDTLKPRLALPDSSLTSFIARPSVVLRWYRDCTGQWRHTNHVSHSSSE